jgi:hypothetical protein
MNISPSTREATGAVCVGYWQDNARLRHRLGEDPDVFLDFVRGALRLAADEEFDRIVTPEFRSRWSHKSLPPNSK